MNLTLDGLELYVRKAIQKSDSPSKGCFFCRYADDMVIFTTTNSTAHIALQAVEEFLAQRGLETKTEKTSIKNIILTDRQGFEFLGFRFRMVYRKNRKRPTGQIGIPTSAVKKLRSKIRSICKPKKSLHTLIDEMNLVIRGWG